MDTKNEPYAGEDTNVRVVHGALWRELSEPTERWRRTPWYLRHFYAVMLFCAVVYLANQEYDWNEYEENVVRQIEREEMQKKQVEEEGAAKAVSP